MNKFIEANPGRCIGCRTCEIACALAHSELRVEDMTAENFKARLSVLKHDNISIPLACHQCEDAPCASVCPRGAIVQEEDRILVHGDKCIGCKNCLMACPYGVMRITRKRVPRFLGGVAIGHLLKALAQKCDLCATSPEGPACVRACPTDVLHVAERQETECRACAGLQ